MHASAGLRPPHTCSGVIAYQLLTGRFPFEDEDRGLLLSSLDVLGKRHFSNKEVRGRGSTCGIPSGSLCALRLWVSTRCAHSSAMSCLGLLHLANGSGPLLLLPHSR